MPRDPTTSSSTRLTGIDLLRALAILLVLFAHSPAPEDGDLPAAFGSLLLGLKRGGWVGVDLFFVLSGFLVSGLLMREHQRHGTVKAGRMLVRRGWKIYPPLIGFVVFMVFFDRATLGYWPTDRLVATALFIQNYTPGMNTHLWSLAVEEHAYLLIAAAFGINAMIDHRRDTFMPPHWMPRTIPAALVIILALRIHNAQSNEYGYFTHQFPTHLRIDGILAGVLFAYFYNYHAAATARLLRRARLALLVAGALLILPPFIWTRQQSAWLYTYGFTTNYLAGLALLAGVLGYGQASGRASQCFAAIGRHSYSIYLWHMAAYTLLGCIVTGTLVAKPMWDAPYALRLALFMAVSLCSGIALSILIELPALKLRDRLSPSRSGTLTRNQPLHAEAPDSETRHRGKHAGLKGLNQGLNASGLKAGLNGD